MVKRFVEYGSLVQCKRPCDAVRKYAIRGRRAIQMHDVSVSTQYELAAWIMRQFGPSVVDFLTAPRRGRIQLTPEQVEDLLFPAAQKIARVVYQSNMRY